MKKGFKLALCGLGLFAIAGFGVGLSLAQQNHEPIVAFAEGEEPETPETPEEPATLPCQVVIEASNHGSVTASIMEGNVGDICVVTAKHDLLYKVSSVSVNGVALIESETTFGEFSFALVEGENKITAMFVVDEELCGELTNIVREASEKDWTNLFTVENAIILVKWILDGGILIAIIRYYVKDKKLEKKLEQTTVNTLDKLVPETTKQTVIATVEKIITPMFTEMKADNVEMMKAMNVFAKCFALSQENTPESRMAVLTALEGLKISDAKTVEEVKLYIDESVKRHVNAYTETLEKIREVGRKNEAMANGESIPQLEEEEIKIEKKQATE